MTAPKIELQKLQLKIQIHRPKKYKYQKYKYNEGEGAHCSSALNFSRDKIVFCSAQDERMPKIFFKKTLEKFDKIRSRI